jgi:hypothetical protein
MFEAWVTRRPVRFLLAGTTMVSGFVVGILLLRQSSFATAIAIFSISQAALVGTGKLASP